MYIHTSQIAEDYGGPKKEFFVHLIRQVKVKFFDDGLIEYLEEDYFEIDLLLGK